MFVYLISYFVYQVAGLPADLQGAGHGTAAGA
jgi:hypothetical protein